MNMLPDLLSFTRYFGRMRAVRRDVRAARFLDSLPPAMRKDIGWPDVCDFRIGARSAGETSRR